jgi:hypothetical protein
MKKQLMLRRAFITIWPNNLQGKWRELIRDSEAVADNHETLMREYYNHLVKMKWKDKKYTGVQIALEVGKKREGVHIQAYVENGQKRLSTYAKDFSCMETCFDVVRDAPGSYAYCSGTGVHQGKFALGRFTYGEFKLHGDSQKADLRMLVNLILEGASPRDIFLNYPYAWCVHRDRILKFQEDMSFYSRKAIPPVDTGGKKMVGFTEGGQVISDNGVLPAPPDTDT